MTKHKCESCKFKKIYENNPRSILGRLWKWHTGWCPGWKKYIYSLPDNDRIELAKKYDMKKYM